MQPFTAMIEANCLIVPKTVQLLDLRKA